MFLPELNNYDTTIKFTADWSAHEVTFLDTRVYMKNGRLEMDLHVKPTSQHQYLLSKSCHHKRCKTAIPYNQALRIKKIYSEWENLLGHNNSIYCFSSNFFKHFMHACTIYKYIILIRYLCAMKLLSLIRHKNRLKLRKLKSIKNLKKFRSWLLL